MNYTINDIRKLLDIKEQQILSDSDNEKIKTLKILLAQNNIFFKLDIDTAIGILLFLQIPEDKVKEVYFSLISAEAFLKRPKEYMTTSDID